MRASTANAAITRSSAVQQLVRRAGLMVLCAGLVGCTTVRPVALHQAEASSAFGRKDDLKPGDQITVQTSKGERLSMKVTALDAASIEGKVEGRSENLRLQNADLAEVQREESSPLKTTGLVTAVAYLLGGLLVTLVLF